MKYFLNFLFALLIVINLNGCKKEQKTKTHSVLEKSFKTEKTIVFGTSNNTHVFNTFTMSNSSIGLGSSHPFINKQIVGNSMVIILDSIKSPMLMETMAWDKNNHFYHTDLFVVPEDSITFNIKNKHIYFYGKHSEINNFLYQINNSSDFNYGNNPYTGSLADYKKHVTYIRNKRLLLLNEYTKNKPVSKNHLAHVKEFLKYDYLYNLICPRYKKINELPGHYFNTLDGLRNFVEKEHASNEAVFSYKDYLDNVTIKDFKPIHTTYDFRYKNSLNAFIRLYFEDSNHPLYSKEKFLAEKKYIQENFYGDTENYLISRLLFDYNKNGFGNSKANIGFITSLINEYNQKFIRSSTEADKNSFKRNIETIKNDIDNIGFSLPRNSLKSIVLNRLGDSLTLENVLANTKTNIKVFNFWASWCGPCISEIKNSKAFKDSLMVNHNVEWIYLSVDENKSSWEKASVELQKSLNVKHQYYLKKGKNSTLAKAIKLNSIPRYIILDDKNEIISNRAPHPSNKAAFRALIEKNVVNP